MNKILVEIYLPAAKRSFDVYIPVKSKLQEVIALISGTFAELSEGYFVSSDDTLLCDTATGTIFNINLSAEELGLHNGSKLMLI